MMGAQLTSPSSRSMRKLLLLILSCGVLGKQHTQLDREYSMSTIVCAMMGQGVGEGVERVESVGVSGSQERDLVYYFPPRMRTCASGDGDVLRDSRLGNNIKGCVRRYRGD